jgi:hypothetical protein
VVRLFGALCLLSLTLTGSIADLNGTWVGTFNGQPQSLLPDGSYPETVTRFELTLKIRGERITGTFSNLDQIPKQTQPVQNAERFGDRLCFDVFDSRDDRRWCVVASADHLEGTWNRGPEGGPATGGLGTGARLFGVRAKRLVPPTGAGRSLR